jgi:hypothetical protein
MKQKLPAQQSLFSRQREPNFPQLHEPWLQEPLQQSPSALQVVPATMQVEHVAPSSIG